MPPHRCDRYRTCETSAPLHKRAVQEDAPFTVLVKRPRPSVEMGAPDGRDRYCARDHDVPCVVTHVSVAAVPSLDGKPWEILGARMYQG
jgi:hypothetical protein